jgi:CheY-like chemotaxis protein
MSGTETTTTRDTTAPYRVLVVDDNRDAANSLGILLRLWGFDARVTYDGSEAIEAAREYRPDCLLSDIGLPGIDGYTLAERLRQDESLQGMTLIALTAYSDAQRAKEAGFDHHLRKPIDPDILEEIVRGLRAMEKRLNRTEKLVEKQAEVIIEAKDLMKEVKAEMKGVAKGMEQMQEELREVKEDVKEIKQELREVTAGQNGK